MLNNYLIVFLLIIIIINLCYNINYETFQNNNNSKQDKISKNYYSLGCWKYENNFTLPIKLNKKYTPNKCYKEAKKRDKTLFGVMNKKCYLGDFNKNYNFYKFMGGSSRCLQKGTGNNNLINIYSPINTDKITKGNIYCNKGCWTILNQNAMPPHQNLPRYTKLSNHSIRWWVYLPTY